MHGSVPRLEAFLQRECGDPELRLRWDGEIERYVVGRRVKAASDYVEWFLVVSDGDSGYRPVDQRIVRKIKSLDTWKRDKVLTVNDFVNQIESRKAADNEKKREVIQYRLKHEARYVKKAAEKDGIV